MDIGIREAVLSDAAFIFMLNGQLGYSASLQEVESSLSKLLSLQDHCIYVAEAEGRVVAWIHAFRACRIESGIYSEIAGLVVDQAFRKLRIGRMLVGQVAEWSLHHRIKTLRVRCHVKREEAHRFYDRLGFDFLKEQKVFQKELE